MPYVHRIRRKLKPNAKVAVARLQAGFGYRLEGGDKVSVRNAVTTA
jgi:hypothetical protein